MTTSERPSLAQVAAAEIRAEMARQRRTGVWMSRQMDMTQPSWSRRQVGDQELTLGEFERVAAVLNVPLSQLLGYGRGERQVPARDAGFGPTPGWFGDGVGARRVPAQRPIEARALVKAAA